MPLILKPSDLAPGMVLKDPVRNGSATLLPAGKALSDFDISTLLRKWPHTLVYIADAQIDDIATLDESINHGANEALFAIAQQASGLITNAWATGEVTGKQSDQIQLLVSRAFDLLKQSPVKRATRKAAYQSKDYLKDHVAQTFFYTLLLAEEARSWVMRQRKRNSSANGLSDYVAGDLSAVGLGALLMDAGMSQIRGIETPGPVSEVKQQAVLEHTAKSLEMLPPGMPTLVKMVVGTHHENLDGSGYPNRQSKDRVHIFSRIVRIADSFDAATSPRVWRKGKLAVEALWEMSSHGPRASQYDSELVGMFMQLMTPFPIGTLLKMQDGYSAAVVGQTRNPFKPKVVMLMDAKRQRVSASELDHSFDLSLPNAPKMGALHGESLRFLYEDISTGSRSAAA